MTLKIFYFFLILLNCNPLDLRALSYDFKDKSEYLKFKLNTPILGSGISKPEELFSFVHRINKKIDTDILKYIIEKYIKESKIEGVNYDISFCQMLLETNFLRFGNSVYSLQNNFAGIGVVNNTIKGHSFRSIYLGVRAHIQHLVAYSTFREPRNPLVDPRFTLVSRGTVVTLKNLTGHWAIDKQYGKKIFNIMMKLFYPNDFHKKMLPIYRDKKVIATTVHNKINY